MMKRTIPSVLLACLLLAATGGAAMADLQVAGFPLRVTGQTDGSTRTATIKISFSDEAEQKVWVTLDPRTLKVMGGRLADGVTLRAGAFTVSLDAAWYDPDTDCFVGTGTLTGDGLPVSLRVGEVTFNATGVRAMKRFDVEKDWLVGGVPFAPDMGTWDGPSLHFKGRMAERPYPAVEVTVSRGRFALQGPLEPSTVLVRGAPVNITGLGLQGGKLVVSGDYPGAKAMTKFSGMPLDAESFDKLPVRTLRNDPLPDFPRSTMPTTPGDQVHDDPHIPGLRRYEAHWAKNGLLTCQLSSGIPTKKGAGAADNAEGYSMVPTGFIKLAPPLGRVSVANVPINSEGQVHLAQPGIRFFWEHRYANVSQIYPPILERVFPVKLGDDIRFSEKQTCFDGTTHPMIGSSITPAQEGDSLKILGMAATPDRVWADAHETDFVFNVAGGQDVEYAKFWFVHFFMRTDKPFKVVMAEFANGEKGFSIWDKLHGLQIWLNVWGLRITLLNFKDFELPFVLRYGSSGFMEVRTRAEATFSNLFDLLSIKNPSLTMLYAPVNSILQNMRCRYGVDEIKLLFAAVKLKNLVLDFVAFGPSYLGFYGHTNVTVSAGWLLDWILTLPDNAPLDLWFGLTEDYKPFRGLFQMRGEFGVKVLKLAVGEDPIAWVRITPETIQSKEPIFDCYMKVTVGYFVHRVLNLWAYADGRSDWSINKSDEPIPIPAPRPVPGPDEPFSWKGNFIGYGIELPAEYTLMRSQGTLEANIRSAPGQLKAVDSNANSVTGWLLISPQPRNYDVTANTLVPGAQLKGTLTFSLTSRVFKEMQVNRELRDLTFTVHHSGELDLDKTIVIATDHGDAKIDIILNDRRRKGTLLAQLTYRDGRVDEYYFPLSVGR